MEQDAPRDFAGSDTAAGFYLVGNIFFLEAAAQQLIQHADAVVRTVNDLHDLSHIVHVGIVAGHLQSEFLGRLFSLGKQLIEVVVHTGQSSGKVGVSMPLRPLGGRVRHGKFVGDFPVFFHRHRRLGVGAEHVAVVEGVFIRVFERNVLGFPFVGRNLERFGNTHGLFNIRNRFEQSVAETGHGIQVGKLAKTFQRVCHGMQRAPAEQRGVVIGQLLEPERPFDNIGMALGQRQHALDSQDNPGQPESKRAAHGSAGTAIP